MLLDILILKTESKYFNLILIVLSFILIQSSHTQTERIVNGQKLLKKFKYPFAGLFEENGEIICGAVLIDCSYAITAAHCIRSIKSKTTKKIYHVQFHRYDLNKSLDYENGFRSKICDIYIHPKYGKDKDKHVIYDIALLKLEVPMLNSTYISLSNKTDYMDRRPLTIFGWGQIDSIYGIYSDKPRVGRVYFSEIASYCKSKERSYFCANRRIENTNDAVDTCFGDSGSGIWDSENGNLVGIVSFGGITKCGSAKFPGAYVKIADEDIIAFIRSHLPNLKWNQGIIQRNTCDEKVGGCPIKYPMWFKILLALTGIILACGLFGLIYLHILR